MKQAGRPSNKKYIILLVVVTVLAVGVYFLTNGALDIFAVINGEKAPSDKEENLQYGIVYQPSSEQVLDRDGIVLKNFGDSIRAVELSSSIEVAAGDIAGRSDKTIERFSEYVSYLYMYDGETVYRTQIGGEGELRATVKDCLKFELMGNYIYSLKEYKGQTRLYRCSITGTYEKILFKDPVEDFWAYGGNLVMLTQEGNYRYYNVITQQTLDHTLPKGAHDVALDGDGMLYLLEENGQSMLYRRPYLSQTDALLLDQPVACYRPGPGGAIALLLEGNEGCQAAVCRKDGSGLVIQEGRSFSRDSSLDLSADHLFVTEGDGATWYVPIGKTGWKSLF